MKNPKIDTEQDVGTLHIQNVSNYIFSNIDCTVHVRRESNKLFLHKINLIG